MIYSTSEDSYLLAETIKKYAKGSSVLDIGSGSGIIAETAIKAGCSSLLASDINEKSIRLLKSKKIKAVKSDLFSKIKGKFDIIAFNPPYLPEDKMEDKYSMQATTGGKKGDEIILKFLKEAKRHLNNKGIILLVVSSLTYKDRIISLLYKLKMKKTIIAEKSLFFEKLEVWKIENI